MGRNKTFPPPRRQAFEDRGLQLNEHHVTGSIPKLNPAHARFNQSINNDNKSQAQDGEQLSKPAQLQYQYRSRDNRKGRHPLLIHPSDPHPKGSGTRAVLSGIKRMFTTFLYWDVSYWVAILFTIGSAIFVACGLFYWLPVAYPSTTFPNEASTAGGITAFVGATLFQIGAIGLVFEAVNENQTGCFGWAVGQALSGNHSRIIPDPDSCEHIHGRMRPHARSEVQSQRRWEWWPSWHEIRTHYMYEIGFLGNSSLFLGSTIFYISGILALPGVYSHLSQGVLWGVYWLTYLVGGILFVISSVLYVLETQESWWKPAPRVIGWHIGVWNLIGSVGWTLSASLGYCSAGWCEYQSDLTLLWASVAFLIGSGLLWFEALDKYPVVKDKSA